MTTSDRIRSVMQRHKMNASQAAVYLGVPHATVNNWLNGKREPSASVVRLLDVLGTIEALAPAIHATMVPPRPRWGRPPKDNG